MQTSPSEVKARRETVLAFLAAMNAQDASRVLEYVTEDAVWRQLSEVADGKEAIRELLESMWLSTDDMHIPLDDVEFLFGADGDTVATVWRATMTMTGYYLGFAPTGQRAEFRGMCLYRMVDGRIAEHTVLYDEMDVSRQLGLLPPIESKPYRMLALAQRFGRRLRGR